jgi:hypothetical protein
MDFFVNELSLHSQFHSLSPFLDALKEVLRCREMVGRFKHPLYCLRSIADQKVISDTRLKEAVRQARDTNLTRIVMVWLDQHGRFWEEDLRRHSCDELFECLGQVVTDCSLGEATFRTAQNQATAILSFRESMFCTTPLQITWHYSDNMRDEFELPNFWEQGPLEAYLITNEQAPQSWTELLAQSQTRFTNLSFLDTLADALRGEPFNITIAERVIRLINILDQLKASFDEQGALTARGHQLLQDFFHGDRALFSDESDTNKRRFQRDLTFRKADGDEIFCPYHGKISFRYYRIHHSWPVTADKPLYIAYIGPKITKD